MVKASDAKATGYELILLRHAKSRWDEPDRSDFQRGLAPRGIKAARRIGKLMQKKRWLPDRVLCSPAERTRQTIALASETWPEPPSIAMLKTLYLAGPARMLAVIRRQTADHRRLLVIAHNPGLHHLAVQLAGSQTPETLAVNLPTAALVRFRLSGAGWSELETAVLLDFVRPRDLD